MARKHLLDLLTKRIEQLAVCKELEHGATPAKLPEDIAEIIARDRSRTMQAMISSGALGGGMLLAGFGVVPALVGAAAGASLAYWLERRAAKKPQQHAA